MPDSLYDYISEHFILITVDESYAQARQALLERGGEAHWALLVRMPDGELRGCRFEELRRWRKENRREAIDLQEMLADSHSPLQPVQVLDEDQVDLQTVQAIASQHTCNLLAFSYLVGQITGVYDPKGDEPSTGSQTAADQPAGIGPATRAAASFSGESEQGSPQTASQTPVTGGGAWASLRSFYQKYRIGVIVTAFWFLLTLVVQYIIPLASTNISDVFPTIFPPSMTGEWNIVVTGFQPVGRGSVSRDTARRISEVFYNHFSGELSSLGSEMGVAVEMLGPGQSPRVHGETAEARELSASHLAGRMQANVIIYGTIERSGEVYLLRPEFFVNTRNFQEAEEIVGQHRLGSDIQILGGDGQEHAQITLNRELSRRSQVLALISQGLGMLYTHQYEEAQALFQAANDDKLWEFKNGREVIYLFQGNAAGKANQLEHAQVSFQQALDIDEEYARAYIGLGSVEYMMSLQGSSDENFQPQVDHMRQALDYYQQAELAENKPASANISAKVAFGRGQVYTLLWLLGQEPAEKALEQFQFVIDEYNSRQDAALGEIASESYGRLGLIARRSDDLALAVERYQQALELATNPARRGLYWMTLGDLRLELDPLGSDSARDAYQTAIQEYQSAIRLTTQLERRAEYWSSIANCHEKLGESQAAIRALEQALELLPEGADQQAELKERLDSLNH